MLLGIRTAIKEDLNATAAEMIYGTGIRLPADFFLPTKQRATSEYATLLKKQTEKVRPQPVTQHGGMKIFIFRELVPSPYVFLRHDAIRGHLQPPYDGPYRVTRRGEKTYTINVNNRDITVSVDRLKPDFVVPEDLETKTAETGDMLIPVEQTNARNESGVNSNNESKEGNTSNRNVTRPG